MLYEEFFDYHSEESRSQKRYLTLIIYDIISNKRRYKMVKLLQGYGFRVQKSAFEGVLSKAKIEELKFRIDGVIGDEDNIKIYVLKGASDVYCWGDAPNVEDEEIVFI